MNTCANKLPIPKYTAEKQSCEQETPTNRKYKDGVTIQRYHHKEQPCNVIYFIILNSDHTRWFHWLYHSSQE